MKASSAGACARMGALVCKCGHPFPFMNHMGDYEYNGDKIRMLPSSVDGRLREHENPKPAGPVELDRSA